MMGSPAEGRQLRRGQLRREAGDQLFVIANLCP
jgi:hypothetical protein